MLEMMANTLSIPVVNAMTDENHPCEIMSDLYTLSKIRTDYLRDNYLFVGADGNVIKDDNGNAYSLDSDGNLVDVQVHLVIAFEEVCVCCP